MSGNEDEQAADVPVEELTRERSSSRTFGRLGIAACAACAIIAAARLAADGNNIATVLSLGLFIALPAYCGLAASVDLRAERRRCLTTAALLGIIGVVFVVVWGDRVVTLLLVPAITAGVVSFSTDKIADQRIRRSAKAEAGFVALGPAFIGGTWLIYKHDLSGSALVLLLLAPWSFFAPSFWAFTDSWKQIERERQEEWFEGAEDQMSRDSHDTYGPPRQAIREGIEAAKKVGASKDALDQLESALQAAEEAFEEAGNVWAEEIGKQKEKRLNARRWKL